MKSGSGLAPGDWENRSPDHRSAGGLEMKRLIAHLPDRSAAFAYRCAHDLYERMAGPEGVEDSIETVMLEQDLSRELAEKAFAASRRRYELLVLRSKPNGQLDYENPMLRTFRTEAEVRAAFSALRNGAMIGHLDPQAHREPDLKQIPEPK